MICVICMDVEAESGMVCDRDRIRLDRLLDDVYDLSIDLPANLERAGAGGPKVSGSREAPLPLNVDVLDLGLPARVGSVTDPLVPRVITKAVTAKVVRTAWHKGTPLHPDFYEDGHPQTVEEWVSAGQRVQSGTAPAGDQIGHISVAAVLDSWVRDWIEVRAIGEHPPLPTVAALCDWLGKRLDWACGRAPLRYHDVGHPAVDEFAAELRRVRSALRAVLGLLEPRPERMDRPCPDCDLMTLIKRPGEEWIDCGNPECRRVYTPDEYADELRDIARDARERMAA